ncbi:MAG TPA: PilZ domain-containing protein [Lacunisphaera sp.]|nr:PilZ domain-containing protein [Lacunisphaera sp.]
MSLFKRRSPPPPPAAKPPVPEPAAAPEPLATPAEERRRARRFTLQPEFPLKAVLSYVGRDDTGAPVSTSRHGWHWKGRLIDCSELGARMQLGHAMPAVVGETCDLRLTDGDFELVVPCHVTHLRETPEGLVLGLRHDITDPATLQEYKRLVELAALSSTLRLRTRTPKPDDSGYFVERYGSNRPASLTVWRHPANSAVAAFEFILKDCLVRVVHGREIEYFAGDARGSSPATSMRSMEIHRLFRWVVPNLPPAIPDDVRAFLRHHAD